MFLLDPSVEASFEIIGSNTTHVANFGSTTNEAYVRFFGNDPNSNIGFSLGCSNANDVTPTFIIGQVLSDPLAIAPNIVIRDNQIGIGTNLHENGSVLTVDGNASISGAIYACNLSPSAYIDTTVASNISSGTLSSARLPTSGVVAGVYGGNEYIPVITVDDKGRITSIETVNADNTHGLALVATTGDYNSLSNVTFTLVDTSNAVYNVLNGNVGIGTSTPLSKLHVAGNALISNTVQAGTFSGSGSNITNINASYITSGTLANNRLPSAFSVNTTAQTIVVDADGNVGLGTNTPSSRLHVQGNIYASGTISAENLTVFGDTTVLNTVSSNTEQMVITNAGTGPALRVIQSGVNTVAEFYDSDVVGGIPNMIIANGGNVGLGTNSPSKTLHVNGDIFASGILEVNSISGDGASLSNLNASYITSGTLNNACLPSAINVATFSGDGSSLSNLNASYITTGTLDNARLPSAINVATFSGDGASLSNLNASYIASGTINNARLPSAINVATFSGDGSSLSNLNATFLTTGTINNSRLPSAINVATFSGDGSSLSNLNANYITSGTINNARLPSAINVATFSGDGSSLSNLNASLIASGTLNKSRMPHALDIQSDTPTISITPDGNVGIGTSNPYGALQIHGQLNTGADFLAGISGNRAVNIVGTDAIMSIVRYGGQDPAIELKRYNVAGTGLQSYWDLYTTNLDDLRIRRRTAGSTTEDAFVIDNARNIGIGTATPLNKLHVVGNGQITSTLFASNIAGNGYSLSNLNASYISTGTVANERLPPALNVIASSQSLTIDAVGNIGVGTALPVRKLDVNGDINFSGSLYHDNALYVSSQWADGGASAIVYTAGSVGIGTSSPQYVLHTEGDSYISHVFTNEVTMTSDSNLKTDIHTIENAVSKVERLRGVEFKWKDSLSPRVSMGLIAQEVERVIPEVVHEDAKGYKSVSYGNMIGLLVEAMKQQQQEINDLRSMLYEISKK